MSTPRTGATGRPTVRRPRRAWITRAAVVVALAVAGLALTPGSAPAGTDTVEPYPSGETADAPAGPAARHRTSGN